MPREPLGLNGIVILMGVIATCFIAAAALLIGLGIITDPKVNQSGHLIRSGLLVVVFTAIEAIIWGFIFDELRKHPDR